MINIEHKPRTLDDGDMMELNALNEETRSISEFVQLVQNQATGRIRGLQESQRKLWTRLNEKYNLDIPLVEWALAPDGKTIIPLRVNLAQR